MQAVAGGRYEAVEVLVVGSSLWAGECVCVWNVLQEQVGRKGVCVLGKGAVYCIVL